MTHDLLVFSFCFSNGIALWDLEKACTQLPMSTCLKLGNSLDSSRFPFGFHCTLWLNRIIALKFLLFFAATSIIKVYLFKTTATVVVAFSEAANVVLLPWSLYLLWLFFLSYCFSTYCLGDRPLSLLGQLCLCPWRPQVCASQEPSELQHGPEAGAFPLPPIVLVASPFGRLVKVHLQ